MWLATSIAAQANEIGRIDHSASLNVARRTLATTEARRQNGTKLTTEEVLEFGLRLEDQIAQAGHMIQMIIKRSVLCLFFALMGLPAYAQTSQTIREAVLNIMNWTKATGEQGFLEGRLVKALGLGGSDELPVKVVLMDNGNAVSRLMVLLDGDKLVVRNMHGANERVYLASPGKGEDDLRLEAAVLIAWSGTLVISPVDAKRGDDGFFASVKMWDAERLKSRR